MPFSNEADFESAMINILSEHGWDKTVLKNYSEEMLIQNWADILYDNNQEIDRLNGQRLTKGEMQQIIEQINQLKTPLKLNGFINGHTVTIKRDNENDKLHFGKEVALKIYDRNEIAAGQSRYQIAEQPQFKTKSKLLNQRRGDLMLLINGMPVIHIELKKSGIPVSQACNQIQKYSAEGAFTGLFSLIQIFVAMNPEEAVYFANPGPEGKFNSDYFFHWANFNNEPINDWKKFTCSLLSIPMAHQLIGYYTVADNTDGVLKVLRSYQYYAASAISDKVAKKKWDDNTQRGGYIWHTTGSGKTLTSFKSAQLIASSKDAEKVVFLVDRIELGTQSFEEYKGFASEAESVQQTENTGVLVTKLKSANPSDTLIVTSIQKMSNIKDESECGANSEDIKLINKKRIVFIIDECHRSTFGDMMNTIKQTFPNAMFFGFTGTPIQDENQKKKSDTASIFGDELHRYSIADGIRDKNVLGFDPYMVLTYRDKDLREAVATEKAKAKTVEEAISDPKKSTVFYDYMELPMAGSYAAEDGTYNKGIEDYIPDSQYECEEHEKMVVKDIIDSNTILSHGGKFHGIFATSSIVEAIRYYRLIKETAPELKVTALFDPNIDNNGNGIYKEEGLVEIIEDYNTRYNQSFTIPTFYKMKKDIAARLAHKDAYERIEREPDKQIDLLIVVDQMLTGFDSKWVNALYMDKTQKYESIIQSFSRTNRLYGPEKPFGTIRYYRKPHTMERNIEMAVKLYSGNKPLSLFADRLNKNLEQVNDYFCQIKDLFESAGVEDYATLPENISERKKFAELFKSLNNYLESSRVQGFVWNKLTYEFKDEEAGISNSITVLLDEKTYKILALRYKELTKQQPGAPAPVDLPYDIDGYLTEINTDLIDADYMNDRYKKYIKLITTDEASAELLKKAEEDLHKTFASLTQEQQKFANIFLHDIQRGEVIPDEKKTLMDYITEYMEQDKDDQIHRISVALGCDEAMLRNMMASNITESNINEFGRYEKLKKTVNKDKSQAYFEWREGIKIPMPRVNNRVDTLLRTFILSEGFDIEMPNKQQ